MWTAVALAIVDRRRRRRLRRRGRRTRCAHGAALWPFVVGLPLAYLAFPFVLHVPVDGARLVVARAGAGRTSRCRSRQRLRLFARRVREPRAVGAADDVLPAADARSAAGARATLPVLLLHGVGCNAGVWTGMRRYLDAQRLGPGLRAVVRTAARVDRALRRPGRRRRSRDPRGDRRRAGRDRRAQHGRARRARLPAPLRRRARAAADHDRHAAPGQHARVADVRARRSRRCGRAARSSPGSTPTTERAAGVPVVSLWSWHDSMVTPQTSSRARTGPRTS